MRKGFFFVTLVFVTLGLKGQPSRDEQRVLDLSKKKFDWLVNKQYDSLRTLLDENALYVHSSGWVQTRQEVLDDMKSGKLIYQKVIVKESSVRFYDRTAIVSGLGTFEGIGNGNAFSMDLRYTEVYIKSGKMWKLASRHANRMP